MMLFKRTLFMSMVITISCILLGYPVAWILANLPTRTANLLMSGAVTQVTLATNLTAALAIAGTRAPTPGDLNGDFRVNSMDITICLSNWGASTLGDTNGDGVTDSRDITVILSNWQ